MRRFFSRQKFLNQKIKYYRDFPLFNPALQIPSRSSRMRSMSSFKVYSIDQKLQEENEDADKKAILTAAARRRDAGQNERYFADVRETLLSKSDQFFNQIFSNIINMLNYPVLFFSGRERTSDS